VAENERPVNGDPSTPEEGHLEQDQTTETPPETQPETDVEETDAEKNWKALRKEVEFLEKQLQQLLSTHRWPAKIFDMLVAAVLCEVLSWVIQTLSR